MSYLKFDKEQLINLEYSLNRELLKSNMAGAYMSTTLNGCNTRKYHGLLICPICNFNDEKHLLLSSLDLSVLQGEEEFNLGIHRYKGGIYNPKGHKYIRNIDFGNVTKFTFRIGSIILTMERLLIEKKELILIRYILEEATEPVTLRFKPFLAFRNIHSLSKANLFVNNKFNTVANGITTKLYDGYPDLFMQFSKSNEFIPVPQWYYNIEYQKELSRGYEYLEDLFVPGYFELQLKPGESLTFAAGTEEVNPYSLKQRFTKEQKKHGHHLTFINSLKQAAKEFIIQRKGETDIIAGFPWYDSITRQTFISLPGLAAAINNNFLFAEVLNTYKQYLKNGLLPDNISSALPKYNSADNSLWFIWAVQQFSKTQRSPRGVWLNYRTTVKEILEAFKNSPGDIIRMTDDGLIYASREGIALTWMDSYYKGKPVAERAGLAVEINALWYNAICFALEMAELTGDTEFVGNWQHMPVKTGEAFINTFWNDGHHHLADVVTDGIADWSVRPNMVIAASLDYSPLSSEQKKMIINIATKKLLTKVGLRTLSPDHIRYEGNITGGPEQREAAIHQGAVWPWLIQFYIETYLKIYKQSGFEYARKLIQAFEEVLTEHCVGTLSEMYNGDPPHKAKGAFSQAWSVAAIVYAFNLVNNYK
ncbi:MAG: amylo-alpha-1,6-glucosidase [Prolixibacteraceae bacterium]|jgi:predicted glycogen debranching enzyme|nr:amylo-alpha-1,6-glucosidase [Prolixibacteraceae bacterium]